MRILVTGANGFVGRSLRKALSDVGFSVRGAVRRHEDTAPSSKVPLNSKLVTIGDIGPNTRWEEAVGDVDIVVHLAARVHIMKEESENPTADFRRVNMLGTAHLARVAAAAGVRRFIFMSTIKVNGEGTPGAPFTENDELNPEDPYAVSKLEAELALRGVASKTGMEVVILRPPLVYGPRVKANFLKLIKLADSGMPLPLGKIRNSRSLIYLGNLVDAIVKCIQHPSAANKMFLVSDGEDLSTPELVRRLAAALGKPARLIPFPSSLLRLAGTIAGKSEEVDRLTGSLVIDSSKIRNELNWIPPFTVDQGLKLTAEWYKAHGI